MLHCVAGQSQLADVSSGPRKCILQKEEDEEYGFFLAVDRNRNGQIVKRWFIAKLCLKFYLMILNTYIVLLFVKICITFYVHRVVKNGAADMAGLMNEDRILCINEDRVEGLDHDEVRHRS